MWSSEAQIAVRPLTTYRRLAADPLEGDGIAARVALLFVTLGSFVSWTSAGRLVAWHVVLDAAFWCFVPALQLLVPAAFVRTLRPTASLRRFMSLYMAGNGPWLLLFWAIGGVCLCAPDVYRAFSWLVVSLTLPAIVLAVTGWSVAITWAFYRGAVGFSRWPAIFVTAAHYALTASLVAGYYVATNQLQPLVMG